MFQDFTAPTSPETGAPRIAALRARLASHGIDAFVVPRADVHQGEYVPPRDERLAWISSFTGSAGTCVVTATKAVLFVDGRYTLQARAQSDPSVFDVLQVPMNPVSDWLVETLPKGAKIGFDPWLHTVEEIENLNPKLSAHGLVLEPCDNLVDAIWDNQPAPPAAAVQIFPQELAGMTHHEKRDLIARKLVEEGVSACTVTLPDSISWLLNIRGADIPKNPVVLAFAVIHADGRVAIFSDPAKFSPDIRAHLGADVSIAHFDDFGPALLALEGVIGLEKSSLPCRAHALLEQAGAKIKWIKDPCVLPKARKTNAEIEATRAAHLRDAGAMAEFLCWLDAEAPKGTLTEIDVAKELEARRRATNALLDISFDTISGAGPDGAIVHYRVTEATNRPVKPGELLLVDSGGQYLDGTTDITRTVAVGAVDPFARRAFTLVLKGMINLSMARWPVGLAGRDLDALARIALWRQGFDYDHGTGHGVGVYLCVHEGPQGISRRSQVPLEPGMIVSNEPGYYREGEFGIRIETLVVVTPPSVPQGGEREMLGFETLTLAPIDRRLIDPALLTGEELDWLNGYHARVLREVAPLVSTETKLWLENACAAI